MKPSPASQLKAPTIYDVAALARVSHQSVSRFLKGERVSEATRIKVEAALAELNYRPNFAARSLATRRSNRIGALMYDMSQVGPVQLMTGAAAAARRSGYVLDIVNHDPLDERSVREAMRVLDQSDVAGILAFAPTDIMLSVFRDAKFHVPVYVDPEFSSTGDRGIPDVGGLGAALAMDHLIRLGHRRIAHISGPLDWPSARARADACAERLEWATGERPIFFEGEWSAESGYTCTLEILDTTEDVTAIFAANDQMALGALHALAERGIPVPAAVSVVGMDDVPEARFYTPSLTTVPLNFQDQGRYAFESLLARIEGRTLTALPTFARTAVAERDSTGPTPN